MWKFIKSQHPDDLGGCQLSTDIYPIINYQLLSYVNLIIPDCRYNYVTDMSRCNKVTVTNQL